MEWNISLARSAFLKSICGIALIKNAYVQLKGEEEYLQEEGGAEGCLLILSYFIALFKDSWSCKHPLKILEDAAAGWV